MSDDKQTTDQYGRRKWNVEIYEQEAKSKKKQTPPTQLSDQTLIHNESSSSDYLKHRNKLLQDSINAVKQFNLINPDVDSSKSYGANKRFGFFCPICDLSFRDNLALIDHLNSPQHVHKANEASRKLRKEGKEEEEGELLEGGIRKADISEVISTIEQLVTKSLRDKSESSSGGLTFVERVEKRRKFEQDKLEQRQQKRQRKKQKLQQAKQDESNPVASIMGFSDFGSKK
ncbi:hypothetical protein JA1_000537 [Spathaspora sp. JA1]|nr:hypothetical protein JA1_000537 [Spathaspora sp. JA1]